MNQTFFILSQLIILLLLIFLCAFFVSLLIEKEKKAALKTFPFFVLFGILESALFVGWIGFIPQVLIVLFFVVALFIFVLPFNRKNLIFEIPEKKFDERDIMFSRSELQEGTEKYNNYYKKNAQNKTKDDLFRKEPGLMSPDSKFYDPVQFNSAAATFSTVNLLYPLVETGAYAKEKTEIDSKKISEVLKNWGIKSGAVDVGFTQIKPHHIYSHIGRGEEYGKEVQMPHKYAIAFTVEMNYLSMKHAPRGPVLMESAQQYLNAGTIAIQMAQFIRNLGFDARAHIDGNYRVICPIVAQDAGLGTIGRMGLLMTPNLGPRVRIGVVTTNMEVDVNTKTFDSSVIRFCEICKKCASKCPSKSISYESGKKEEKLYPWKINHEKCYTYWCKAGTDCGRCMAVCPYSHPDSFVHNIIRRSLKKNPINRWLALRLDDYFYG